MKDYPGRMAALFFTAGCNFRCGFCHNPDLFATAKTYTWEELDGILSALPLRQVFGEITRAEILSLLLEAEE